MSNSIIIDIAKINDLSPEDHQAFNESGFGYWTQTQVWTWEGGFAILGNAPTRGPQIEGWCFYRLDKGEPYRKTMGFSMGINKVLRGHDIASEVAPITAVFEDSSPTEVLATLCGH